MTKVLSLFKYEKAATEFYPYLIFKPKSDQSVFLFSPDVMKLTNQLFVADLQIVRSYWLQQGQKEGLSFTDKLSQFFVENELAIFCHHPFQGLLFYNHLDSLDATGVYPVDALFSKKILRNMAWHPWLLAARQVHECFELVGLLKKERKNFFSQLNRFERFVQRMDLATFFELESAHFYEIQRRFKGFLGSLWLWTFPEVNSDVVEPNLFNYQHHQQLKGFVWQPYQPRRLPEVKHYLEYPISQWQQVEPWLLQDFYALEKEKAWPLNERILQCRWKVTFFDMDQCLLEIPFRYPIDYHEQKGQSFAGLLRQFKTAFESLQQSQQEKADELEMTNVEPLIAWDLSVAKCLQVDLRNTNFFQDPERVEKDELIQVDQKLKHPIQRFRRRDNFLMGYDYQAQALTESGERLPSLPVLSQLLPLSLFNQPQPLAKTSIIRSQFLQRTAADWWQQGSEWASLQDHYLCELEDKSLVFAFRDYQGEWYQYGQ